ncbi:hypothetical protein [uncultured Sneathia sp.]|nr:hypothetical protein [uncultured Sneathia sp.]
MKKLIIFYSILLSFFAFADEYDKYDEFRSHDFDEYTLEKNKTDY